MKRAFTLVELLVCIAVIALLIGLLAPALGRARESARTVACASNQRQMAMGWALYAGAHSDRAMPLAYWSSEDIGAGQQIFWWGTHGTLTTPVDYSRGFLAPYLDATLSPRSVFECPCQPWGSYRPQGPSRTITSTYGYNGYYLSPAKTPGWGDKIGFRPWRRLGDVQRPGDLYVFADALLSGGSPTALPSNTALLDPPCLYSPGPVWETNDSATTAFRHGRSQSRPGVANAARADGSVRSAAPACIVDARSAIGSATAENDPAYVPDWRSWR